MQLRKLRLRINILAILLVLLATTVLPSLPASAVTAADWRAGNIISDSIFFNNTAMTGQQIQNFLNSKVPVCRQGYTCLKDYRQDTPTKAAEPYLCNAYGGGNKSATEIIYDVAQICGVNPQVLLVLLQKEQSLVTDTWPEAIQYRSATGFGCPDTAPCDAEYYGFFNQVYHAARIYRKYIRDAANYNHRAGRNNNILYNPNSACGSSTVYIENQATAGLYNYTPYQPNAAALNNMYSTGDGCSAYGNRNFWRMFNDWFGSTQGSFLVRTPSNPTYYVLTAGKKYAIPSGDILYAYGIDNQRLDVVSDNFLGSVSDGGMLGTLFTVPGDGTVFLADLGKRIGIASGEYCTRWGLQCGNPSFQKVIGNEIFDRMGNGGVLQSVMRHGSDYFLMENGTKKYFVSTNAMWERGYNPAAHTAVANWTNAIRPFGTSFPESDAFIKFANSSAIYLYSGGGFWSIPDYPTFLSWYSPTSTSYFDKFSSYNTTPPAASGALSTLVSNGGNKYLLDGGKRINVTPATAEWPAGLDGTSLAGALNKLPLSSVTVSANSNFRLSNGAIFRVSGQTKRPYNSVYDFQTLSTGNTVQLATTSLPVPAGQTLLAEGSAYKVSGSDAIYLVGQGNKSYAFVSVQQIYDFATNLAIPTISSSDAAQFSYQGLLTNLIKDSQGNLSVVVNGARHPVPASSVSNWGFSAPASSVISDGYINRFRVDKSVTSFIGGPNGTIYAPGGGNKRPIATYQRYQQLGGNLNNTVGLPANVVDALPTGPVIN